MPLPKPLASESRKGESRETKGELPALPSCKPTVLRTNIGGPLKRMTWHRSAVLLRPRPHLTDCALGSCVGFVCVLQSALMRLPYGDGGVSRERKSEAL